MIRCTNAKLYGQKMGIQGLLGSPIDIILEINTLEGRTYRTTLSSTDSYYQIPPPPGIMAYLGSGTLPGLRNVSGHWELLLVFMAWFLLRGVGRPTPMLAISALAVSLGYLLSAQELLLVPSWAGVVGILLTSLALLLPLAMSRQNPQAIVLGLPLIGLGCLLVGAGLPLEGTFPEYTLGERVIVNSFTSLGLAAGVMLLAFLARQCLIVLSMKWEPLAPGLAIILAGLALGVLIWKLTLFWYYPSMLPPIPGSHWVVALSLSVWAASLPGGSRLKISVWAIPALITGFLGGILGIAIPFAWSMALAVAAIFPLLLLFREVIPGWAQKVLLGVGGIAAGNYLLLYADEFLSYPRARAFYFMILLLLGACLILVVSGGMQSGRVQKNFFRVSGSALLLLAILSGLPFLLEAYRKTVAFTLAEGSLPLPLLSMGLLLVALLIWPRYRKIHRHMGLGRKPPVWSLALLTTALFLLPAWVQVRNPWHQMDLLDEKALQGLLEQRLWNTYSAFNLADEKALFEQLSENLDAELLDNIYLDSRRRLTMGLREGTQVSIREVSLDLLEKAPTDSFTEEGTTYGATWTVTAQVKHLRHIHYRKNRYTGTITMKPFENQWKISKMILTSEDREVIAASTP